MGNGIRTLSIILLLAALVAAAAWAGPLDRNDTGPRVNPETTNMLRVPGVIGLDYQSALAALQQAGLNPRPSFIRHPDSRYQGEEGDVIGQLPLPGGMAMLGSSVTIRVYQPKGAAGQAQLPATTAPPPAYDTAPPAAPGSVDQGYGEAPADAPAWQPSGAGTPPSVPTEQGAGQPAGGGQPSWQPPPPPADSGYGTTPQGSTADGYAPVGGQ